MKKRGFLSAPVAELIASMGHTDRLIVCDAGFPVPPSVPRIDLAISRNLPAFPDVLRTLLEELAVESFVVAAEMQEVSPRRYAEVLDLLPDVPHDLVPHTEFKRLAHAVRGVIRTGDFVPYSNIMLVAGVVYP
jgi:D-ribose pyranase